MERTLCLLLLGCNGAPWRVSWGEVCDGRDNDGDSQVDEGLRTTWYADNDGDGYGAGLGVDACAPGPGWVGGGGDCDDDDPHAAPGRTEGADGKDNDCDGRVDEGAGVDTGSDTGVDPGDTAMASDTSLRGDSGATAAWVGFRDADGDGPGDPAAPVTAEATPGWWTELGDDCDDTDPSVFPGATEACNERDDDCDAAIDEDLIAAGYYADADGDGYGDPEAPATGCAVDDGYAFDASDCDDEASRAHPGGTEVCNTGVDEDCDGSADACTLSGSLALETADFRVLSDATSDESAFGAAVAGGGDIDGDGYDDVAIGRPEHRVYTLGTASNGLWSMSFTEGTTAAWLGGELDASEPLGTNPTVDDTVTIHAYDNDMAGTAIGSAIWLLDFDLDGELDIGARGKGTAGRSFYVSADLSATSPGWSYEVYGDEDTSPSVALSDAPGGTAVATDATGDGQLDLLLQGELDQGSGNVASVFLVPGPVRRSMSVYDWASLNVSELDSNALLACDFNADGIDDVLAALGDEIVGYAMPQTGSVAASALDWSFSNADEVVACADLDEDGDLDFLVGGAGASATGSNRGGFRFALDPATANADADTWDAFVGEADDDALGAAVALGGDLDADGHLDLVAGAVQSADPSGEERGLVYILPLPLTAAYDLSSATRIEGFDGASIGASIAAAGDVNADGFADLAVGSDSTSAAAVWIILGRGL